jgi:hypothetical protein
VALYPKCLLRVAEPLRNLVVALRSLVGKPDVEAAATKPQEDGLGGGVLSSFLGDEGVEVAEVLLPARAQAGVLLLPAGAPAGALLLPAGVPAGVLPEEVHELLPFPISYIGDKAIRRNIPPQSKWW